MRSSWESKFSVSQRVDIFDFVTNTKIDHTAYNYPPFSKVLFLFNIRILKSVQDVLVTIP